VALSAVEKLARLRSKRSGYFLNRLESNVHLPGLDPAHIGLICPYAHRKLFLGYVQSFSMMSNGQAEPRLDLHDQEGTDNLYNSPCNLIHIPAILSRPGQFVTS
jgi:hypothetical protein